MTAGGGRPPRRTAAGFSPRRALTGLSLRWKIAALLAAGCALVAVTIGLLIHQSRSAQIASTARESALAQLMHVRQVYELTGQVDRGDARAALNDPELPDPLLTSALAGKRSTYLDLTGPHPQVWAARPVGDRVLSVRRPLDAAVGELGQLDGELVAWGAVVVGLAALGGAGLASRLSRRLRTAAATARRISGGELDARIGRPAPGGRQDEVAELACAVDTMAASLQERLVAEQRFTADVAHELRTPLTGLHTAAELLPPSRPTDLVRNRVSALRTLTEDLLEVARLDANAEEPHLQALPLDRTVTAILQRCGASTELTRRDREGGAAPSSAATLSSTGDPLSCATPVSGAAGTTPAGATPVGAGVLVQTDARRLERIVANLVANARRHGAGPVEVTVDGASVSVRDHGPGFPEHLLKNGPQRFVTGARERGQGTGLGLTIALGQAHVIGADVTLRNAPDGCGALAVVSLPRA
ncbi:HAMP domain-containing sensor histidine kinase [Streptomyces sp. NBC_00083]|uniref:HAMP domain-containing sensor histidine kinase n=1 Tax=Streptomyces sp. NBC_00083 TaxID=2975647 RepID=UPI002254E3F1|nr:HAMP domain-containing sensor histidine kinase [Streptomyces sp. NBC_00083]MCX5382625.1 HAMP domain-containing histidine kinase [Streptomyces sp. NBC_00083]